ncbi:MAG: polysaccharide biosynthesis tyrosine autokinase [Lachnospiraceae bacterium]|nr:polysaccharide biosynthesis tyrosine autokinase [Lachnospiraceae bacterium]
MQEIELKKVEMDFHVREAYKTLRSNVEFSGEDIRVVAVTSCAANEGKSSTSYNLARAFAENGSRVLLIDADLRKSVMRGLHKRGRVRLGLVHALVGKSTFDDIRCKTDVPNLEMVFAGPVPPNPSELLGNKRFKEIVKNARKEYHYIIIDTPPIGSVIDGAVVAKVCDGVMLVIESGNVSYRFAQKVKEQLEKAGCRILGVVLNKVNLGKKGYYGKYYGNYYGSYGN